MVQGYCAIAQFVFNKIIINFRIIFKRSWEQQTRKDFKKNDNFFKFQRHVSTEHLVVDRLFSYFRSRLYQLST